MLTRIYKSIKLKSCAKLISSWCASLRSCSRPGPNRRRTTRSSAPPSIYAWSTAAQSATAALALLLPGRRRLCRQALAYAALVATVSNHAMLATDITHVIRGAGADPGSVAFWFRIIGGVAIIGMLGAADHVCFLALSGDLEILD